MSDKKLIRIKQENDIFTITWVLNNICTNHCDYCPPDLHMGQNHHYEWHHAKSFSERLMNRHKKIHLAISGGEPTLSPFFPELVKMFSERGHAVGVTSNAARTVKYWSEVAPYLSYICFSYHPSFEDPAFFEKVMECAKHCPVTVRVMMDDRHWNKSVEMFNKCYDDNNISVEPVRILTEMSGADKVGNGYTSDQEQWILESKPKYIDVRKSTIFNNPKWKQLGNPSTYFYNDGSSITAGSSTDLKNKKSTDFRGWACNIGIESLFIHYDGLVRRANCFEGGQLFHINDHENHELPSSAVICFQNICHCGTDVQITKVKIFEPTDRYIEDNINVRIVSRTIPVKKI